MTTSQNLYNQDFYLWTEVTAQQLQERKLAEVDLVNLIEEVESMGRSEKRELKSRLIILLMHLLKWMYQPGKRSNSWRNTISEQRICLEELLEDSPSLKTFLPEAFEQCYQKARDRAAKETGINLNIFPLECPVSPEEVWKADFLPENED
ncbi:MAG: DUF29 domain-containing protein [Spirulinaceae cyanobacterium]